MKQDLILLADWWFDDRQFIPELTQANNHMFDAFRGEYCCGKMPDLNGYGWLCLFEAEIVE